MKKIIKVRVPKGFKLRKTALLGNIPRGKTTVQLYLKKGVIPIPFPKSIIINKTGWSTYGGGRDKYGEYINLRS